MLKGHRKAFGGLWLLGATLGYLAMGISGTVAQPSSPPTDKLQNLFVAASERDDVRGSSDPSVVRARAVRLNVHLIAAPQSLGRDEFRLNLFDDTSFVVVFERAEVRSPRSYTWFGRLTNEPYSSCILVVNQGVMAARIRAPGKGVYEVGNLAAGVHVIREIDEGKLPQCGVRSADGMGPEGAPVPCTGPNSSCVDDGSEIDVLVVYTQAARIGAGGTAAIEAEIQLAIDTANNVYANSLINTQLNLVLAAEIDYDESGPFPLPALQDPRDGVMDEVHDLRDQVHADLVSLVVEDLGGFAGVAQQMNYIQSVEEYGFSVLRRIFLGAFTHEIGHNMGCAHERVGTNEGFLEYSFGRRFVGDSGQEWFTEMAGAGGAPGFSNPNVLFDGQPTGIPAGTTDSADNARTINETALMLANIRPSVPLDCNGNGTDDDEDIASGTSNDQNNNGIPDECEIILHVDASAPPGGDGTSWATAYDDLQDAIVDAACPCRPVTEIWVAAGTYTPDRGAGDRKTSFNPLNLTIYGGFAGNEGTFAERAGLFEQTILSGDLNGDDGLDFQNNGENSYTVVLGIGTDTRAIFDGFTIAGGHADGGDPGLTKESGGGVFIDSGTLTLSHCHITGNSARQGAGINVYGVGSAATLVNCTIRANKAMNVSPMPSLGGGMSSAQTLRLINCELTDNSADRGGGIYLQAGTALFANCLFDGNTSSSGGGLFVQGTESTVINSTFSMNSAAGVGGGVLLISGSTLTLHNSILWNNIDTNGANSDAMAQIADLPDFGANVVSVETSCIQDDDPDDANVYPGTDNIDDDPLFVDMNNDDFHLSSSPTVSPAVDAGNDAAVPPGVTSDLDGNPRFNREVDMGSYELQGNPTSVDDPEAGAAPRVIALRAVYPNPSNFRTTIEFDLDRSRRVEVSIYDLRGRVVRTLLEETRPAGTYRMTWDGADNSGRRVASGMYLVRVRSEDWRRERKVLLLK